MEQPSDRGSARDDSQGPGEGRPDYRPRRSPPGPPHQSSPASSQVPAQDHAQGPAQSRPVSPADHRPDHWPDNWFGGPYPAASQPDLRPPLPPQSAPQATPPRDPGPIPRWDARPELPRDLYLDRYGLDADHYGPDRYGPDSYGPPPESRRESQPGYRGERRPGGESYAEPPRSDRHYDAADRGLFRTWGRGLGAWVVGSLILASLVLLLDPSRVISRWSGGDKSQCQEVVQPQSILSREQLVKLLAIPERSAKSKIRQVLREPYCYLASLRVRSNVLSLREAYPLEFDTDMWLVILYEGEEYAGYRFSPR